MLSHGEECTLSRKDLPRIVPDKERHARGFVAQGGFRVYSFIVRCQAGIVEFCVTSLKDDVLTQQAGWAFDNLNLTSQSKSSRPCACYIRDHTIVESGDPQINQG